MLYVSERGEDLLGEKLEQFAKITSDPPPKVPERAEPQTNGRQWAAFSSLIREQDPEKRMSDRSTSSPYAALALLKSWKPVIDAHKTSKDKDSLDGGADVAWREAMIKDAKSNYTPSRPRLPPHRRLAGKRSDKRLIIVIPVAYTSAILVHQLFEGVFGVPADLTGTTDYKEQASKAAEYLSGVHTPPLRLS